MTPPRSTRARRAPRYLTAASRRWWESVVADWELEQHHIHLLTAAAEAWDRLQQARVLIRREGLTVQTRSGGPRLHPAVRVEQDSRLAFARLVRELDLDVQPPAESRRPPALRSVAR